MGKDNPEVKEVKIMDNHTIKKTALAAALSIASLSANATDEVFDETLLDALSMPELIEVYRNASYESLLRKSVSDRLDKLGYFDKIANDLHQEAVTLYNKGNLSEEDWRQIRMSAKYGSELKAIATRRLDELKDQRIDTAVEKMHLEAIELSQKSDLTLDDWVTIHWNAKADSDLRKQARVHLDEAKYYENLDEKHHQMALDIYHKGNLTEEQWYDIKWFAKRDSNLYKLAVENYEAMKDKRLTKSSEKFHQEALALIDSKNNGQWWVRKTPLSRGFLFYILSFRSIIKIILIKLIICS